MALAVVLTSPLVVGFSGADSHHEVASGGVPTVAAEPVAGGTWSMTSEQGFAFDLTVKFSSPQRFADLEQVEYPGEAGFSLGEACGELYDRETDAVVTGAMTVVARTQGKRTPIHVRAIFSNWGMVLDSDREYIGTGTPPFAGDGRVSVEESYDDTAVCQQLSSSDVYGFRHTSSIDVYWELPESETGRHPLFIIVHDFYSDTTPLGDSALLDWIVFRPYFVSASSPEPTGVYSDEIGGRLYMSAHGVTLSGLDLPAFPSPSS